MGVAEDPAGGGFGSVPEGNDYKGGAGAEARGTLPPPYNKAMRDAQGHLQRRRHIRNLATCCLS